MCNVIHQSEDLSGASQQGGRFIRVHPKTHLVAVADPHFQRPNTHVDLCRFKILVAQVVLERQRSRAAVQQVHGVAVAERMRRDRADREAYPLGGAGCYRVTQPVAGGVVGDGPDRLCPVAGEGVQVIAQPPHKIRIEQGQGAAVALRWPSGLGQSLLLERGQCHQWAHPVKFNVSRGDGQRFVDPCAGVP